MVNALEDALGSGVPSHPATGFVISMARCTWCHLCDIKSGSLQDTGMVKQQEAEPRETRTVWGG